MSTSTVIRSWPAIGLGAFFAGITGWVLLADVVAGVSPLTPAHMMSIGAIVAAIASGHAAWPQIKRGAIVPALMLCVLFVASTSYVVIASAARNAETSSTKAAAITTANGARAFILRDRAQSVAMRDAAVSSVTVECRSGDGPRCRGARATLTTHVAAIEGFDGRLAKLGPELAVNGGYAVAAKVLALLPGITAKPDAIEERLVLILPFLTVLIAELGCITFLNLGLGHAAPAPAPIQQPASTRRPNPPQPPRPGTRRPVEVNRVATKAAAEADVIHLVGRGVRLPSQDTLALRWGIHKSTASRWLADMERRGIVRREWDGRHNQVASA